jgi:hypothetical protein
VVAIALEILAGYLALGLVEAVGFTLSWLTSRGFCSVEGWR